MRRIKLPWMDSCTDEGATKPIIEFEDATGCSQQQSPSSSSSTSSSSLGDHYNDVAGIGKVKGSKP